MRSSCMTGKTNSTALYPLLLFIIIAISFAVRYASFDRTTFAVGRDAYFHVIQARSLLEDGKTHAPDSSFTPYVFALTYQLVGEWESAQKILLCTLIALITLVSYFGAMQLFHHLDKERQHQWALLLAFLVSASPSLTHIAAQYLKQLLGMLAFMLFLWAMLWNLARDEQYRGKKEWLIVQILRRSLMLLAVMGAMFSHRLSGVLAFGGLAFALPWLWLLIGAIMGVGLLILGSVYMPGILSILDAERFHGLFRGMPSFHPAALSRVLVLNPGWSIELVLPYIMLLVIIMRFIIKKEVRLKRFQLYMLTLLLLAVFPFYDMTQLDFGFRVFIAVIPVLPFLYLSVLEEGAFIRKRDFSGMKLISGAGAGILFLVSCYFVFIPDNMLPYRKYKGVIYNAEQTLNRVKPEIVILHHGFSFFYTYVTYRHTLPFIPDWEVKNSDVYRIAYNIPFSAIEKYGKGLRPLPQKLSEEYTLFREDVWQSLLSNSRDDEMLQFRMQNPKNPYQKRPAYLARFQDHTKP